MKQMPLQYLFVLILWIRNILPVEEKLKQTYALVFSIDHPSKNLCSTFETKYNNPDPPMKKR